MNKITTVKVMKTTRDRLAKIGSKNETYDDVINRLVDFYEKNNTSAKVTD